MPPKKASPKKASPKKASPKKASPKKASPKKPASKKAAPKKASPKKAPSKTASKPRAASSKAPSVSAKTKGDAVVVDEDTVMAPQAPSADEPEVKATKAKPAKKVAVTEGTDGKPAAKARAAPTPTTAVATMTRLRTLTAGDKKVLAALRSVVAQLAAEAALKTNRIPQLMADVETEVRPLLALAAEGAAPDAAAVEDEDATKPEEAKEDAAKPEEAKEDGAKDEDMKAKDAKPADEDAAPAFFAETPPGIDAETAQPAAPPAVAAPSEATEATEAPTTEGAAAAAAKPAEKAKPAWQHPQLSLTAAQGTEIINGVLAACAAAKAAFQGDAGLRLQLDEDLVLRPVAHAVLVALNTIEGFATPPARVLTAKQLEAKAAKRQQALDKVKSQQAQSENVAQAKEQERVARENARRKGAIEDTTLPGLPVMDRVRYAPLPFGTVQMFERGLFVWATAVSLPVLFHYAQMPFSTFVLGVSDKASSAIAEDLVAGAIKAADGTEIASKRNAARGWLSSALGWIQTEVDADAAAAAKAKGEAIKLEDIANSGASATAKHRRLMAVKKKKAAEAKKAQKRGRESSSDEDFEEDSDEDEEEEGGESSGESDDDKPASPAKEGASPKPESAEPKKPRNPGAIAEAKKLKAEEDAAAMAAAGEAVKGRHAELLRIVKQYARGAWCAWENIDVDERLVLLEFLVRRALRSVDAAEAADAAESHISSAQQKHEQDCRAAHDAFKTEMKRLKAAAGTPDAAKKKPRGKPAAKKDGAKDESPEAAAAAAADAVVVMTKEEIEQAKVKAQAKLDRQLANAARKLHAAAESDNVGTRIRPLGRDRYRRMYWHFPQDRRILVQTVQGVTATTYPAPRTPKWGTPALAEAGEGQQPGKDLIDDEEEILLTEEERLAKLGEDERRDFHQSTWGYITAAEVVPFAEGQLDQRGLREYPLQQALLAIAERVAELDATEYPADAVRMNTRSSRHTNKANYGWMNVLNSSSTSMGSLMNFSW